MNSTIWIMSCFLTGIYLLLQSIHIVTRTESLWPFVCVTGKLFCVFTFLFFIPVPAVSLLAVLTVYPRKKAMPVKQVFLQLLFLLSALFIASLRKPENIDFGYYTVLLMIGTIFFAMDFIVSALLVRNKQLYRQMEQTAIGELRVKCLNEELSRKAQLAERNARLMERENIARNIHNVVGHTITSAIVSLQAYEVMKDVKPEAAKDKLTATSERMHLALEEIRRVVRVMDSDTDEVTRKDFCSLLENELVKFSMDTEIQIYHNLQEFSTIDTVFEKRTCEFLHSMLNECLNNGIRHGQATEFFVFLNSDTNHIRLSVTDNGTAFQKLSKAEQEQRLMNGFGLRKIREYVEKNAGSCQIDTDNGFRVSVTLPITLK